MKKYLFYLLLLLIINMNISYAHSSSRLENSYYDIRVLESALDLFKLDIGRYPSTEEGLEVLVKPTDELRKSGKYNNRGYLKRIKKDSWNNPYQYINPGIHNPDKFDLWTFGRDGKPGGEGTSADLGNWAGSYDVYRQARDKEYRWQRIIYALVYGVPTGFIFGLPVYIVGYIRAYKISRYNQNASNYMLTLL